jgi:hypothetical protein
LLPGLWLTDEFSVTSSQVVCADLICWTTS